LLCDAKIVDDDNVAGLEGGHQNLLDIGEEAFAFERSIDHAGSIDAVTTQTARKVSVLHRPCGTLATSRFALQRIRPSATNLVSRLRPKKQSPAG
jgi:hypothetical protein